MILLPNQLRELRERRREEEKEDGAKEYRPSKVAQRLGVTDNQYSMIESGRANISSEKLAEWLVKGFYFHPFEANEIVFTWETESRAKEMGIKKDKQETEVAKALNAPVGNDNYQAVPIFDDFNKMLGYVYLEKKLLKKGSHTFAVALDEPKKKITGFIRAIFGINPMIYLFLAGALLLRELNIEYDHQLFATVLESLNS